MNAFGEEPGYGADEPGPWGPWSAAGSPPEGGRGDAQGLVLVHVQDPDPYVRPVDLGLLTGRPMPRDVHGALVERADTGGGRLQVTWLPDDVPPHLPAGRIMLRWRETEPGSMEVTARLGVGGEDVALALWPSLTGEWSGVVRPTLVEVTAIQRGLEAATATLDRLLGADARADAGPHRTTARRRPAGARHRPAPRREQ